MTAAFFEPAGRGTNRALFLAHGVRVITTWCGTHHRLDKGGVMSELEQKVKEAGEKINQQTKIAKEKTEEKAKDVGAKTQQKLK
jgi:hypothetical protein